MAESLAELINSFFKRSNRKRLESLQRSWDILKNNAKSWEENDMNGYNTTISTIASDSGKQGEKKMLTLQDIKVGDTLRVIKTPFSLPYNAPMDETLTVLGWGIFPARLYNPLLSGPDFAEQTEWVVSEKDGRPYCTPLAWCERYYNNTLEKNVFFTGIDEGGREMDCSVDTHWSKRKESTQISMNLDDKVECTCDIMSLMAGGCTCGAINKERNNNG